jgi:hypothetical protein
MPSEINGLPVHALIVHATVVIVPLAAIAAILFAVVPNWRFVLRWPVLVSGVLSFVLLFFTKISGNNLDRERFSSANGVLLQRILAHKARAYTLFDISIGFAIAVVAAVWVLGFDAANRRRTADGTERSQVPPLAQWGVALVLVGFSVATLIWVVLTGEAGARTIWGQ